MEALLFSSTVNGWLILKYLVWGIAALYTVMTVSIWSATVRTLGLSSLRHCPRMLRLSFQASPIRELVIALLVPFIAVILGSIYEPAVWYLETLPVNGFLLIAVLCFTLFLVPPTTLVLSTSTNERLRWALALKRFTGGRRVISLLDTGYMSFKPNPVDLWAIMSRRSLTLTDVLRTSDTSNWQAGVKELIGITPIVVVDTRVCTNALLFEASTMLTPPNVYKAIFVSQDDGACPVLEKLLAEGRVPSDLLVSIVKKDELGQVLRRLVTSKQSLPKLGSFAATPYVLSTRAGDHLKAKSNTARTVPYEKCSATDFGTKGRKRLSIALTPILKFLANAFLLNIFLSLVLGSLVVLQKSELGRLGLSRTAWSLLVIGNCGIGTLFYCLAHPLKEVYLIGEYLLVSDYSKQSKIHLSQISHLAGPDWTTLRRITLHLRQPSVFGKRIVFAAGPFRGGKIARELQRRLYSVNF